MPIQLRNNTSSDLPTFITFVSLQFAYISQHINTACFPYISFQSNALTYLFIGIATLFSLKDRSDSKCTLIDLLFVALLSTILISPLAKFRLSQGIHTEYFLNYLSLASAFYILKCNTQVRLMFKKYFYITAIVCVLIEIIFCGFQYVGLIANFNSLYRIGGSSGHPGATAAGIVILMPFVVGKLLDQKNNTSFTKVLFLLVGTFVVILILYLNSRAAFVSLLLIFYLFLKKYFCVFNRLGLTIILIIVGFFLTVFLFYYKYDSSLSRLFIWRNSITLIEQNPILGIGLGRFDAAYNQIQHDYFANNNCNSKEAKMARYVGTAYNDFVELSVESGLIAGFALLLIIFISILQKKKLTPFYISFISMIPIMMTWTTLKYLVFSYLFILSLSTFSSNSRELFNAIGSPIVRKTQIVCVFLLSLLLFYFGTKLNMAFNEYRKATKLKDQNRYKSAALTLHYDSWFLIDYSIMLHNNGENQKAIEILNQAGFWSYTPRIFVLKGEIYEQLGNNNFAIQNYKTAYFIEPSRLYPKYLLAKLFDKMGDCSSSKHFVDEIVEATKDNKLVDAIYLREKLLHEIKCK